MFEIGQKVVAINTDIVGKIVYVEDDIVYIETANGAEHEFDVANIKLWEPAPTTSTPQTSKKLFDGPYIPRKGDRKLAARVMELIKEIFPSLLDAARMNNEKFDELDAFDKVKTLSEVTNTPMIVFMGAGEMEQMWMMEQVIRQTILNDILDGGSLNFDMLIGRARRAIKEYEDS